MNNIIFLHYIIGFLSSIIYMCDENIMKLRAFYGLYCKLEFTF